MKTNQLPLHLVVLLALASTTHLGWAEMKEGDGSDGNARVWASPKEAGMNFFWQGRTNARHEAEGHGILDWSKAEKNGQSAPSLVYTGEMKAGRRHGTGILLQRSGAKYSGQWSENVKEGKGEYWFSNGDFYSGLFHNDVMHGTGRYVSTDGTVFEGTFINDERDGPGTVIFPDGRRYASTWAAGKDTNPAVAPRVEKPYLMVGIDVRPYALNGKMFSEKEGIGDQYYLTYRGRWNDGAFAIDPDWPYWVAWSSGGPVITGHEESGNFTIGAHPAFLELRLYNPGREKLEIRRAEVVADESHPDLEPILRLQDANAATNGGVSCEIVNFSASRVDSCEIAFNILPSKAVPTFESYQFTERVEPFTKGAKFSLANAMGTLGMDAASIAAIEKRPADSPVPKPVEQRVRRSLGKFPKFVLPSEDPNVFLAYATIAGEVRIGWTDHAGAKQTKAVKFQFRKCFALFGAELAVPGPSSGKYDVMLKTAAKKYLVPFEYKKSVAPGANDRFTLQVAAEASTYHRFRIRLTTADGREILSPPCRLHFLVQRDFSWKEGHVIEAQ